MTHGELPSLAPSAQELLNSFRIVVEERQVPNLEPLILNVVNIMGLPTDFVDQPEPIIELYRGNNMTFSSRMTKSSVIQWSEQRGELMLKPGIEVFHDTLLVCRGLIDQGKEKEPEEKILFQLSEFFSINKV